MARIIRCLRRTGVALVAGAALALVLGPVAAGSASAATAIEYGVIAGQ